MMNGFFVKGLIVGAVVGAGVGVGVTLAGCERRYKQANRAFVKVREQKDNEIRLRQGVIDDLQWRIRELEEPIQ